MYMGFIELLWSKSYKEWKFFYELIENNKIDLYVAGNPVHPLTFINGIADLLGIK